MSNEELGSLVRRNPLKVVCVLIALLSGVGIYFINTKIADATIVLEDKTKEGSLLAANVKSSTQLAEQVAEITSATEQIQRRMIRATELATNLQYFYRLETESGIELTDLRQSSGSQPVKLNSGVAFAVSVKGEFETIMGWLQRLENGPHYCRVLSATMGTSTATSDRSGPLTLGLSLELLGQP
jgi:hypothetical protein